MGRAIVNRSVTRLSGNNANTIVRVSDDEFKNIQDANILLQSVVGYNGSPLGGTVYASNGYPYANLTATQPNAGGAGVIPIDEIEVDSVIAKFGSQQGSGDEVELHIYNPIDELLESVYSTPYTSYQGLRRGGNRDVNRVNLDLHTIFRDLGYISGKFKFQLNFHRRVLGNSTDKATLVGVSPDRTEVIISYTGTSDLETQPIVDFYGNRLEYYLNYGENLLYRIALIQLNTDLTTNTETVYTLTLVEPLPAEFGLGDLFWIDLQVADPQVDTIVILPVDVPEEEVFLRGPNFNVEVNVAQSTALKSWDDLLGSNPTSSQQLINKFISSSFDTIELPIDYRDYSNFVFYGSATERLDNFRYKLQLIEYYQNLIAASTNISNPYVGSNYDDLTNKLNNIFAGFDGYEKYLYYESSSYETSSYGEFTPTTWPKQNADKPYTLFSVNSTEGETWYRGQRDSASYYDRQNNNNLLRLIPEHIITDRFNETYVTFVNMIGQHFDILWSYVKHLSKISNREESLNAGLAKDLVYHVLKSYGIDSAHGFKIEELWLDALALNSSGVYTQSGSLHSIPNSDISKETFKRILNNLPYLLKTKGTKRGIRALLNCYGIPSTVYRVKEFSGPYQYKSLAFDNDAQYRKIEKFTLATYFNGANTFSPSLSGTATRIFRFKPASPTGSTNICTGISLTYTSGIEGTLKGVTGPWYNGYWTTVASTGGTVYAFQVINGRVIDYNLGAGVVGTTFGGAGCNVYVQEIKGFSSTLGMEELREHARNPQSLIGSDTIQPYTVAGWQNSDDYDYTTSYSELLWRYPMGTTLQTYTGSTMPSIHPNQTTTRSGTISGFTSASYVGNEDEYYVWYPNLADSLDVAEKIRIESASLSGSLSPDFSVEKNQFDFYSFDSPKVGVYFSPQDEINEDIADQFSGLSMDNLIGDPRDDYKPNYSKLQEVSRHYNLKYTGRNSFWKYIKLIENFDASMFYLVKKFLPARSVKMVGLVIQPTLLERSKIPQLGNLSVEKNSYDMDIGQLLPDNLTGEYVTYEGTVVDFTTQAVYSDNLTYEATADITTNTVLNGDLNSYEGTATLVQGAISSNIDIVMDSAGIPYLPAGTFNHSYGGSKISSRGFNIPSDDTFDGAPVIELWTNSPNSPINTTGQAGSISIANSPNVTGGKFNAIFPNGLLPGLNPLGGRAIVNVSEPVTGPLGGRAIVNVFEPVVGPLEGRAIVNRTGTGFIGGGAM